MSGGEVVRPAELTADEIDRRLEAGETIEVYMRPRDGLGVMAGGAIMSSVFAWQYVPRALEDAFLAIVGGVVFVPAILAFLWLLVVGFRRWRSPPLAFALRPEGIEVFMRPRVLRWEEMQSAEVVRGGIVIEARRDVDLGRSRLERFATLFQTKTHGVAIPTRFGAFAEDALLEFVEARIEREMIHGDGLRGISGSDDPGAPTQGR